MYLMLAVESGIVGLLVFLLLIGILWLHSNSIGRVAVVLYAVSSFFSHTNLEQPAILCLMAMVAVFYPRKAESATFLQDQSPPQRSKARL
jgi:O-antigen ligase